MYVLTVIGFVGLFVAWIACIYGAIEILLNIQDERDKEGRNNP